MGTRLPQDLIDKILAQADMIDGRPVQKAPPPAVDDAPDEKAWDAEFRKLFTRLGWEGYHTLNSRGSKSGYPDWTLVRERVVWVELKTETGQLTAAQECWRDWIKEAGGEWWCWRPGDYLEAERVLTEVAK
jgi:hypothetical protein